MACLLPENHPTLHFINQTVSSPLFAHHKRLFALTLPPGPSGAHRFQIIPVTLPPLGCASIPDHPVMKIPHRSADTPAALRQRGVDPGVGLPFRLQFSIRQTTEEFSSLFWAD
ncbi:hypothetical protein CDAR_396601 [Caerostris darwini]|uniref:Uncharacterized protein n=1 Tax=Caerostris darwini TaxID=1538125 RepID=A0AAV4PSI3_9ARAC|nr:hypothetical protein CDAR_396601 [Caerostris darwini]